MPEIQTGLAPFIIPRHRGVLLLLLLVLGVIWTVLINHLQVVWSADAEYRYGWAVPVLCLALMMRQPPNQSTPGGRHVGLIVCGLTVLALLYAPTRLIGEANPDWRLISWGLALEVVGVTLALVYFALGPAWLRRLAFPIAFFLVAVPWPTFLENDVIQGLTRADTGTAVEVLDWLGVSALQHGNVIEVATGNVGVDEACSGIRSLQATLMISLFLGESYQLNFSRRLGLLLGGFALSFIFNLTRMCILTWVAAHQGIAAIKVWHDQTGNTVLVACCLALWGLGILLARKKNPTAPVRAPLDTVPEPQRGSILQPRVGTLRLPRVYWPQSPSTLKGLRPGDSCSGAVPDCVSPAPPASPVRAIDAQIEAGKDPAPLYRRLHASILIPLSLLLWFVAVEISVESWYRWYESRLPPVQSWSMAWPTNQPGFATVPLSEPATELLHYDTGQSVVWHTDGAEWEGIYLTWRPEHRALVYAKMHTPDVCITAAGNPTTRVADWTWSGPNGLQLPFGVYTVANNARPMHVFYCMWSDRSRELENKRMPRSVATRLAPVLAGVRNAAHRSLEIAVTGNFDEKQAEAAVSAELAKIIQSQ